MGSYCTKYSECGVFLEETVECRNSKCQCAVGYVITDDGLGCSLSGASSSWLHLGIIVILVAVVILE